MRRKILLQLLLAFLIIHIALFAIANTERRVALVWGNSSYLGWDNLPVCTNDADTIADKLAGLGFDTILLKNGTRDEMMTSLEEFEKRIEMEKTDVAVFFYSGHAFNQGDYYLVPSNTELNSERIKRRDYLPASFILEVMENSRLSLLFFDACRVGGGFGGVSKGSVAIPQVGLANDNNKAPKGLTIYYATQDDQKATTGNDGLMSPFSRALANHLLDRDEFRSVWPRIQSDVMNSTDQMQRPNSQEPYENSFYFNPAEEIKSYLLQSDGNSADISYEDLLAIYKETEAELKLTKAELSLAKTELERTKQGNEKQKKSDSIMPPRPRPYVDLNKLARSRDVSGISISKFQGIIDWDTLRNNTEIKFVYIRATEGSDYVDARYNNNITNARNSGIKVGSYHFLSTRSPISSQFENFINTVKIEDQDLVPLIDCETIGKWTPAQLRDSLELFANMVEQHFGCKPMVYTSQPFFTSNLGTRFANYLLWIAKYSSIEPNIGYDWTLWEFADDCKVPGIEGNGGRAAVSVFNKMKSLKDIFLKPK